jgi:hypothetical protein
MATDRSTPSVDIDKIAAENPRVDPDQIHKALELALELGVRRPRYRLERSGSRKCQTETDHPKMLRRSK